MKNSINIKKIVSLSFVFLMLFVMYIPLLLLFVFSFTATKTWQWAGFSLALYAELFTNSEVLGVIGNTLIIAFISALLAMLIGTITAVGIFYLRKIPRAVMNSINQITVINADIVTGIAFMLFFVTVKFIPDGYITLVITHTIVTIPYVVLSVLPRLGQLNPNIYEAGVDLGASPLRTLFTVVVPQLIPAMLAGFVLAFTLSLDDFVITKFNNGGKVNTISTYIYNNFSKAGLSSVLRAVSSLIFVVSLACLIAVNAYSTKKNKLLKRK